MSTKKPTAIDPGGRWLEYWSESSKAHFYFEIKTQATSFTKPAGTYPMCRCIFSISGRGVVGGVVA